MRQLMSVHHDNLVISSKLSEYKLIDLVIFDPVFRTLYNGDSTEYNNFLSERVYSAANCLTDNGKFVSINYSNDQYFVKYELKQLGLTPDWECEIPINDRGKTLKNPNLKIICFSKDKSPMKYLTLGDAKHLPGNSNVHEGMPMWEIEGILHALNIDNSNIILDMFGGSGAVALAAYAYGASCITIENQIFRYEAINERLGKFVINNKRINRCAFKTCDLPAKVSTEFGKCCNKHYAQLRYYSNRNMFLGKSRNNTQISTGNIISLKEQIGYASMFLEKSKLERDKELRLKELKKFSKNISLSSSLISTFQ